MLAIDIAFFLVELISGFMVHSLALMADAFHMLNDIISLIIGLWAVNVAKKETTDKYSYGFVRAEILGAFFNAVFLIALCVSIILEALTRFIEPQEVTNPKLILIVGCCGLASNLVGFLVLGGHGHSHGPDDHDHDHEHGDEHVHDSIAAAEEGRARSLSLTADKNGRHIQFNEPEAGQSATRKSASRSRDRRRSNSVRHSRLTSMEDLSIHPASFRQEIIDRSKSPREDETEDESSEEVDESAVDERAPLIRADRNFEGHGTISHASHGHDSHSRGSSRRPRRDSGVHTRHNHNRTKSQSRKGGHGHNHADMGMNAMILHVIGDALGNVGVIATALIIWLTNWPGRQYADPAVSLFITLIILKSAIPLTRATSKVLLQATPDHLELSEIREDIQNLPGVVSCHHVHIWQLSDTKLVASLHIQVAFPITEEGGEKYMKLAKQARKCLHAYGIHSATIQPEFCLDEGCHHSEDGTLITLDGHSTPRCGANKAEGGDEACLLECVDDCVGQGCCAPPKAESSRRSSSTAHDHEHGHGHTHDHGHGHEHDHHR